MSNSTEEQYKSLNLSLDDLSITSEIKPINSEESVNLLDKFNEISDKNKFEINDFEKKDINNKVEKELNNSAKIVSNDINEVKNNDPEINKLNDSDKKEVPNIINDSAILDQIFTLLDEKDFAKANDLLVEAQNKGINNGRIYLAKIMLDMNASNLDQLGDSINFYNYSQNSIYFNEALSLCDKEIQICLKIYAYKSYCKNVYYNAKILLNEAKEYSDTCKLEEVSKMFEEIIDYNDSKDCYELCKKLLKEWDKNEIKYNKLLDNKDSWKSASLKELLDIENEIKELGNYNESNDLINEIQPFIDKKQKKLKKYQIDIKLKTAFLVLLILIIIICFLLIAFVNTDFVQNDSTLPIIFFFSIVGVLITTLDLLRCYIFKPKI